VVFGEFLKDLWGSWVGGGGAVIWLAPGARSIHVPIDDIRVWDTDDEAALADLVSGKNTYTSPGLRRAGLPEFGKGSQGTQSDVIALAGFALDVDLKGGKHVAEDLPVTDDDVAALLSVGPDPSRVVATGGGLHFWWLFEEPWALGGPHDRKHARSAFRAFQESYIKRGEEFGFHVDLTATIQHLFRLPGTRNWKRSTSVPVETAYADGPRYPLRELVREVPRSSLSSSPPRADAEEDDEDFVESEFPADEIVVDEVRAKMRRLSPNHRNKTAIEAVLAGESFAEPGKRDDAMQAVCSTIAWLCSSLSKTAEELSEILRPSLFVWASEPGAEKTLEEELEKAVDKLERAIEERNQKQDEEAARIAVIRRFFRLESTGEEVDRQSLPNRELPSYSIIQYKNSFWAQSLGFQDGYRIRPGFYGPFIQTELMVQLGSLWENGAPQFSLTYWGEEGEEKAKTVLRVTQEYATGAHDVLGHFALQESYFDPATRIFHEAICPIRPLMPEFDPRIDEWLRIMGGRHAEQLLDWIAAVTQLDYQCCALYLAGPPDCGKSLLATGLARLWHVGGATPLARIMGDFNAEMFRCPLIGLDEGLPDRKFKSASSFLRSLVGSSTHTYNQKNIVTRKVVGAIRLLISANNDNVLKFGDEELSALDLQAVVGRFLHLRVSDDAATWIEERNAGRKMTEAWVEGDGIPRHALWLREHRKLNPGRRFLVEGETTMMHKALVTQGRWSGVVLEWLVRLVNNPDKIGIVYKSQHEIPRALVGNQKILVNTQAIVDCWNTYLTDRAEKLSTSAVGRVLNQLSDEHKPKMGSNGERIYFHQIDPDLVFSWAEENQIGDLEAMHRNLTRQLDQQEEPS
jgi:hypothetical protein